MVQKEGFEELKPLPNKKEKKVIKKNEKESKKAIKESEDQAESSKEEEEQYTPMKPLKKGGRNTRSKTVVAEKFEEMAKIDSIVISDSPEENNKLPEPASNPVVSHPAQIIDKPSESYKSE